jgi:hypothetical protein
MQRRPYYSERHGRNPLAKGLGLPGLLRLFRSIYNEFERRGYFQEAFGYDCVDDGFVPGTAGADIGAYVLRHTLKDNLWPFPAADDPFTDSLPEDDLFDFVEFLWDEVSKPLDGYSHTYADCGWHYRTFDKAAGQAEYRDELNGILRRYGDGYELTADGEIVATLDAGLDQLLDTALPDHDHDNVNQRVAAAITKFRSRHSSPDERRAAVRDLSDVLEFLRPQVKEAMFHKDEAALFQLANGFGIRHHNEKQQREYDTGIWHAWMFFYYLATIHAVVRVIKRQEAEADSA